MSDQPRQSSASRPESATQRVSNDMAFVPPPPMTALPQPDSSRLPQPLGSTARWLEDSEEESLNRRRDWGPVLSESQRHRNVEYSWQPPLDRNPSPTTSEHGVPDYSTRMPTYDNRVPEYGRRFHGSAYREPDYGRRLPSPDYRAPDYGLSMPSPYHRVPEYDHRRPPYHERYAPVLPEQPPSKPNFWDDHNFETNAPSYARGDLAPPFSSAVQPHGIYGNGRYMSQPSSTRAIAINNPTGGRLLPQPIPANPSRSPPRRHRHRAPQPRIIVRNLGEDSDISSDEYNYDDDRGWVDSDNSSDDSSQDVKNDMSGQTSPSKSPSLRSDVGIDDDLLKPQDWRRKMHVTETIIKRNHQNRSTWPDAWRHSDMKTCPSVLRYAWAELLHVDHLVNLVGLDALLPALDSSKLQSKRMGSLAEVFAAFESQCVPSSPSANKETPGLDAWHITSENFLRLLKARDYMVQVCCDAESLSKIHPTLDTITWFEQAALVDKQGSRSIRDRVIELKSLRLSHLVEIIRSLNRILQALLWGWSDDNGMCIRPEREKSAWETFPIRQSRLSTVRLKETESGQYDSGELQIQKCLQTLDLGLESLVDEVEVFAAILSLALVNQCDVHITDESAVETGVKYGSRSFPSLSFYPYGLKCMHSFIQGRRVWVLMQFIDSQHAPHAPYVGPPPLKSREPSEPWIPPFSFIRTTVVDLARIWGPIWAASKADTDNIKIWYRLPGGYIGAPRHQKYDVTFEPDEFPCHFSVDAQDFLISHSPGSSQPTRPYLMIGHGLPSSLKHQKGCQIPLETGLEGLALQSATTQKPFRYKDASVFNVAVGYGGSQASWSTQFKTNPGVRAKESLLLRWNLEPKFRNPRLLLLWYGLEVSLCTRNARRCRLLDLLRSEPMIHYLSSVYRPDLEGTDYKAVLLNALKSSNPYAFIETYDHHPEWQAELGTVVARCLNILKESGVNKKGDLSAFAFVEKFHDSEQLVILPKNDHSWIGLLQDSSDMATFALASHRCFEYRLTPGQSCRRKDMSLTGSKSVLETSYTVSKRSNPKDLLVTMNLGDRLAMTNHGHFKIQRLSSKGILLGTWRVSLIPQVFFRSNENFQEGREDAEPTIRVFVASRKEQRLPQLKGLPEIAHVGRQPEPASKSFHACVEEDLQSTSTKSAISVSSSPQSLGDEKPKIPERSFSAIPGTNGTSPPNSATNRADDSSQTVGSHSRSDNSTANATPLRSANKVSRINRSTQTDLVIIHADSKDDTSSSTKDGQSLRSPSDSGASHSRSSRHSRSRSHDERNESSSRHRHHHRHKESRKPSFNDSDTRDENASSGYGLRAFLRSRASQPIETQD